MTLTDTNALDKVHNRGIALLGMSGVGKTRLSNLLRTTGGWYHYSVDYRLGSAYLAEHINDDLRSRAMQDPCLAGLLRGDAVTVRAKIGINNLSAMSTYLGAPGNSARGGLGRTEFLRRQDVHARAERGAMADLRDFQRRAREVLGYRDVVCDTSGSLCSIVDPIDAEDPILTDLAMRSTMILIAASEEDESRLIDRFRADPKPIFYSLPIFEALERDYPMPSGGWENVQPDDFRMWAFPRLIKARAYRYAQIADGWGYTIPSAEVARIGDANDFEALLKETMSHATAA